MPTQQFWNLMRRIDTPTVCNAIEVAQGKRGFQAFTRQTMLAADPMLPAMCGYARTARIAARRPSEETPETVRERRMSYYRYMASGEQPSIAVVEDVDYPECVGAFWGEVNSAVHAGLGMVGALTNGVMRDLADMQKGFQVIAGSIGPSHGFVHVVDFDQPVDVCGLEVRPGDLVHADRHGAVVVPHDVIGQLEAAVDKLLASERVILEPARAAGFDIAAFENAWAAFEQVRT
jgi:regulator of RNase E activity RraA